MKLDCGCDTTDGTKCTLHEWPWVRATCPECEYPNALRHKYNTRKYYCESCGLHGMPSQRIVKAKARRY